MALEEAEQKSHLIPLAQRGLDGLGLLPVLDGVTVTGARPGRDTVSSNGSSTQIGTTSPELGSS